MMVSDDVHSITLSLEMVSVRGRMTNCRANEDEEDVGAKAYRVVMVDNATRMESG